MKKTIVHERPYMNTIAAGSANISRCGRRFSFNIRPDTCGGVFIFALSG